MDVNANLTELLRLSADVITATDHGVLDAEDAARAAELVLALNEWITRGGSLPSAWSNR